MRQAFIECCVANRLLDRGSLSETPWPDDFELLESKSGSSYPRRVKTGLIQARSDRFEA